MRQTLLSRWQGALLGSSLGGLFGIQEAATIKSWQEIQEQGVKALAETGQWQPVFRSQPASSGEMLVQCLPLILFFHDQPQALAERLSAIAQQQNYSENTTDAILTYATVISWSLQEKLTNGQPQAPSSYGGVRLTQKNLCQKLQTIPDRESSYELVQTLQGQQNQGKPLQEIKNQLTATCQDIGLALYCFGTTLEDLALSVGRVNGIKGSNPLVFPLVGALSGVQNGVNGIPLPWRLSLHRQKTQWESKLASMLATWSGSYEFAKIDQHLQKSIITDRVRGVAIAPSGVIQVRQHQS